MTQDEARRLSVLVVDDEAMARKRLTRLLAEMPDVTCLGECADGHEALARVQRGDVDVVLLDIQMPGLSGLEALQLFPAEGPVVIFCTAHPAHAVEAFEVGALDYVLKPVEEARLRKALDRARSQEGRRRFQEQWTRQRVEVAQGLQRLALPTRAGIVLIDPKTITHALLENELVTVFTETATYLSALSLQDLEERLPPEALLRVHRKALLNLAHVTRLEPVDTGGLTAKTSNGHDVEISRQAARDLRKRLGLR